MVFGLFSKERSLKRAQKKALSKLAQSAERWGAMETLSKDGSEESLFTLCKRFSFESTKQVEDHEEKQWVVETLVSKGMAVLPALRRYMQNAESVAYHLGILERIADKATILEVVDELLADEKPGYTRDPKKRTQIIDWLGEWEAGSDSEAVQRVLPYLADFDENVRFSAVNAISLRPIPEVAEPLVAALLREDEESRRLRVRIADILAEAKLDLCGRKKEVAELTGDILSAFRLKRDKLVRKK